VHDRQTSSVSNSVDLKDSKDARHLQPQLSDTATAVQAAQLDSSSTHDSAKLDSTNMFHWCPAQSLTSCLLVSQSPAVCRRRSRHCLNLGRLQFLGDKVIWGQKYKFGGSFSRPPWLGACFTRLYSFTHFTYSATFQPPNDGANRKSCCSAPCYPVVSQTRSFLMFISVLLPNHACT